MSTNTYNVSASADDGDESNLGVVDTTATTMTINSLHWGAGIRFQNVNIAQGTQITSATLTLNYWPGCANSCYSDIFGIDADDVSAFGSGNKPSDQPQTTEFVPFDLSGSGQADHLYYTVNKDVTAIVQEILDRPGYAKNAMGFVVVGDTFGKASGYSIYAYDDPDYPEASLEIVTPTSRRIFIT